jgi:hypothetical protein
MKHNAHAAVDHIRRLAAAERAVLHVTTAKTKGGRTEQAMLKPYQANRADRSNKPEWLDTLRDYLGRGAGDTTGKMVGVNWTSQEADDGMAQAHYQDPENTIICSADKDLLMVPGWKLDMYNNKIRHEKDAFGWIDLDRSKSSAKVVGGGTKFFWAQCLMGDQADNISGVPEVPGSMWQQYAGTASYRDTYGQWIASASPEVAGKLREKLEKMRAKTKKCGPVLTFALLEDANNDRECFEIVRSCYTLLEKEHGYEYTDYRAGGITLTPTQALLSEMRLLWMRRNPHPDDVLHWIKEIKK